MTRTGLSPGEPNGAARGGAPSFYLRARGWPARTANTKVATPMTKSQQSGRYLICGVPGMVTRMQ